MESFKRKNVWEISRAISFRSNASHNKGNPSLRGAKGKTTQEMIVHNLLTHARRHVSRRAPIDRGNHRYKSGTRPRRAPHADRASRLIRIFHRGIGAGCRHRFRAAPVSERAAASMLARGPA